MLLLVIGFNCVVAATVGSPQILGDFNGLLTISQNALVGATSPTIPIKNEKLIDCLAYHESQNNPSAFNPKDTDGRPKYGLLQFDAKTFQGYCVERYNLRNDIWNPDIQIMCADRMIADGGLSHWGTKDFCKGR